MLSKIKKYYFGAVFFALYSTFAYQLIMAVAGLFTDKSYAGGFDLAMLPFLWLALMAARYLMKKSSNSENGGHRGGGNNHFRR